MPTLLTSEFPIPKIWDEFEEMVWEIFRRRWRDTTTQRNGRSGQRQHGVDVFGRSPEFQGKYVGIQCKRVEDGALTEAKVRREINKAEKFVPPIAHYIIAVTERRDAAIQEVVRKISEERENDGKFATQILFWDDITNMLADPENHDLIQKYYHDWLKVFAPAILSNLSVTRGSGREQLLTNWFRDSIPQTQLNLDSIPPADDPPRLSPLNTPRSTIVDNIIESLRHVTWAFLTAGQGQGKTQLARNLMENLQVQHKKWISLQNIKPEISHIHFRNQLALWISKINDNRTLYLEFSKLELSDLATLIAEQIKSDGILIVDNLPDHIEAPRLFEDLMLIASIFRRYGTLLLSNGQYGLAPFVQADLSLGIRLLNIPIMDQDDVQNMMVSANAPNHILTSKLSSFITGITKGHPALIAANVLWMKQNDWKIQQVFEAFIRGEPTDSVREHTRRSILRLLDTRSREFLYRLELLDSEFDRSLAFKVAMISPPVEHPGEILDELVGPWISRLERGEYQVSPLLKGAGKQNLKDIVQQEIHKAYAAYYLSQSSVTVSKSFNIAFNLFEAKKYDDFAKLLIQVMISVKTINEAKQIEIMSSMLPPSMEWPSTLSLDARIMLRAAQIRIHILLGKNASELDADLEKMIAAASSDNSSALLFAFINTGPLLEQSPPLLLVHRTLRIVKALYNLQRTQPELAQKIQGALPGPIEEFLWLAVSKLDNPQDTREFFAEVQKMPLVEQQRILNAEPAIETIVHLVDIIWVSEAEKPPSQQKWDTILLYLENLREYSNKAGASYLRIATYRAKAIIIGEYLSQPHIALESLIHVASLYPLDASFLLNYTISCILFSAGRFSEAIPYLESCIHNEGKNFIYSRFDARKRAGIAYSKTESWDKAKLYIISAIKHGMGFPDHLIYDQIEMLGELAWVQWSQRNHRKCCACMYGLVSNLVVLTDTDEPRYREVFNKAAHSLGWFVTLLENDQLPILQNNTSSLYPPVEAGLFGFTRPLLRDHIPPLGFSKSVLLSQLAIFAACTGSLRTSWKLYGEAKQPHLTSKEKNLLAIRNTFFAPLAAHVASLETAIDIAEIAVKIRATSIESPWQFSILDETALNTIETRWGSLQHAERQNTEWHFLLLVFIPLFIDFIETQTRPEEIHNQILYWRNTISSRSDTFTHTTLWYSIIIYFERLTKLISDKTEEQYLPDIVESIPILKALWYFVDTVSRPMPLRKRINLQLVALEYLIRVDQLDKPTMNRIGSILHRHWTGVAQNQPFSLRNPRFFSQEIASIPSDQGIKSIVKILKSACIAIGFRIPPLVLQTLNMSSHN